VRASNEAARSLYRKYGFQDAGLRKRYYSDNKEDAVIMTTLPIQSAEYRIRFEALVRDHAARWGHAAGAAG
jgi:ribosomal-protein-alanine N-acetyltransferase